MLMQSSAPIDVANIHSRSHWTMTEHSNTHSDPRPKSTRGRWLGAMALIVLVAGGGIAISGGFDPLLAADSEPAAQSDPVSAEPRTMQLHASEVYQVASRDLASTIEFTGTLHPTQRADISAQVSGIANDVYVQPGDSLEAGEVLVQIDPTDLELQLRQQQATLASTQVQLSAARQTLDRTQALADKDLTPQSTLDAAIAEVDRLDATLASLQSQVDQVQTNIERTTIRAPFAGTVSARVVEPGQVVSQGAVLVSMVDLSRMTVDAMVPLSKSAAISVGQIASLDVQGFDSGGLQAEVERVNPVAVDGTRSVIVHLGLDNPRAELRGGMFVTGSIVTEASCDTVALPTGAVLGADDERYVLALEEGQTARRDVEIAKTWEHLDLVEIASGLGVGDVVVVMPLSGLEAGQSVMVGEL